MGECVTQLLWMMHTLKDYRFDYKKVQVLIDNIAHLIKNLIYHSKTEHIEVKYHFVRNHITNSNIELKYIEFKSNIASIFTKPLVEIEFSILTRRLSLCS